MMRIYKTKDYDALSRKAASVIAAQVTLKPDCVLGLATGSSPLGTYKYLIERYNQGELDFSEVKTANLDEYRGLTRENDQSYYYFMYHNLFKHVNINMENTNIPDGTTSDPEELKLINAFSPPLMMFPSRLLPWELVRLWRPAKSYLS